MTLVPTMGLEIHAELLTKSKIFCSCRNEFGGEKNSRICPVCAGLPGALPVLNKDAVTLAVCAGLALDCRINNYSAFDRKNYFYPDLPKAYQITQFEYPICEDGVVQLASKQIRINRIHIEEDAGKLIHDGESGLTEIDFNRCGVPLIEIVTEPDFESAEQVVDFVNEVSLRLKYAGVCDAHLEKGSLRVDVNISLKVEDSKELGVRAEIKNLNSVRSIRRAIEYEIERQSALLQNGEPVIQQTRRFSEQSGKTTVLRNKESTSDYRYFPEPNLPPIIIDESDIEIIKNSMPEMPQVKFARYTEKYGLSEDDARLILADKAFSDFFEAAVTDTNCKTVANLMLGELNRNLNESGIGIGNIAFSPADLAALAALAIESKVSLNAAKEILSTMFKSGGKPCEIAERESLFLKDNTAELGEIVTKVLSDNTENVKSYIGGNQKLFGFFMGEVMHRAGRGTNPAAVREILSENLEKISLSCEKNS